MLKGFWKTRPQPSNHTTGFINWKYFRVHLNVRYNCPQYAKVFITDTLSPIAKIVNKSAQCVYKQMQCSTLHSFSAHQTHLYTNCSIHTNMHERDYLYCMNLCVLAQIESTWKTKRKLGRKRCGSAAQECEIDPMCVHVSVFECTLVDCTVYMCLCICLCLCSLDA